MGSRLLIACLLIALPFVSFAKDEPCTDGVDCFCDLNPVGAGGVVFCEDFEDTDLYMVSFADRARAGSWWDVYGSPTQPCTHYGVDQAPGGGDDWMPHGQTTQIGDGTGRTPCLDVVQEDVATFSDKGCGVSGETDCVWQGTRSLGHRFVTGDVGGITGRKGWTGLTQFGITFAVMWSENFLAPGDAGCLDTPDGGCGPANKMNEWGGTDSPLVGASVSQIGVNNPFAISFFTDTSSTIGSVLKGDVVVTSSTRVHFRPDPAEGVYEWRGNVQPGDWICIKAHYSGWNTTNTTMRYWFNDTLMIHATGVDTVVAQDTQIGAIAWNHYYNGKNILPDSGYPGTTSAYRYEDNMIVVSNAEPVSCAAIGLGSAPPPGKTYRGIIRSGLDLFRIQLPFAGWPNRAAALRWARGQD